MGVGLSAISPTETSGDAASIPNAWDRAQWKILLYSCKIHAKMNISQNIKLAVDAIVFGYQNNQLQVLLIKQRFGQLKDQWALVGGFVKDEEPLRDAVERELAEEAGIQVNFLEQLYTFGDDINRDPRGRVISVAYFALVNPDNYHPKADTDALEVQWFPIDDLPPLAFDHHLIIQTAHDRLKAKLRYQPIGFDLLPKHFLFSDLEQLYSTILEVEIDRRNFRKKVLSLRFVEETDEISQSSKGRPAKFFRFNPALYKDLIDKGVNFDF